MKTLAYLCFCLFAFPFSFSFSFSFFFLACVFLFSCLLRAARLSIQPSHPEAGCIRNPPAEVSIPIPLRAKQIELAHRRTRVLFWGLGRQGPHAPAPLLRLLFLQGRLC